MILLSFVFASVLASSLAGGREHKTDFYRSYLYVQTVGNTSEVRVNLYEDDQQVSSIWWGLRKHWSKERWEVSVDGCYLEDGLPLQRIPIAAPTTWRLDLGPLGFRLSVEGHTTVNFEYAFQDPWEARDGDCVRVLEQVPITRVRVEGAEVGRSWVVDKPKDTELDWQTILTTKTYKINLTRQYLYFNTLIPSGRQHILWLTLKSSRRPTLATDLYLNLWSEDVTVSGCGQIRLERLPETGYKTWRVEVSRGALVVTCNGRQVGKLEGKVYGERCVEQLRGLNLVTFTEGDFEAFAKARK